MLFNSIEYLIFLLIAFLLYWFAFGRSLRLQNAFVVAASYLFYGWWDWRFLLLIALTTLCSYVSGLLLERGKHKRLVLWSNIILNLGILGLFKYYDFFIHNLETLLGVNLDSVTLNLILPVGISFYTFQALSYSIDVYRGSIRATHDAVAFFAFISFFLNWLPGRLSAPAICCLSFCANGLLSIPAGSTAAD